MDEVYYDKNRDDSKNIEKQRKINLKLSNKIKKVILMIVCAILIITVNCFTVSKFHRNAFSIAFEFIQNGLYIDLSEPEVIELPTSQDDPFGIFAECAKYDIYPQAPYYLPEGYVLVDVNGNINKRWANFVSFTYKNGKKCFTLDYTRFWGNRMDKINIPGEHHSISEININGKPAIISEGSKQFTMAYEDNQTTLLIVAENVPYNECYKMVESIRHKGEFLWLEEF